MTTIEIVLKNSAACVLDKVNATVDDAQDVTRLVIDTIEREQWTLAVGDVIQIEEAS